MKGKKPCPTNSRVTKSYSRPTPFPRPAFINGTTEAHSTHLTENLINTLINRNGFTIVNLAFRSPPKTLSSVFQVVSYPEAEEEPRRSEAPFQAPLDEQRKTQRRSDEKKVVRTEKTNCFVTSALLRLLVAVMAKNLHNNKEKKK